MKAFLARHTDIYKLLLLIAYVLPILGVILYVLVMSTRQQFLLLNFFPTVLLVGFLLSPLICIYYSTLTFLHTLIDELWICKMPKSIRIVMALIAFVCSALWSVNSIIAFNTVWKDCASYIPAILMVVGFAVTVLFQITRFVFEQIYSSIFEVKP